MSMCPPVLRWLALAAALTFASVAQPQDGEPAPPAAEWTAIKAVIEAQLAALKRDDGRAAFAFATRSLQRQFESPENFMRMVHAGYQSLIDARYSEFLEGAVIDGNTIQPLRLVLNDNTVLVALYQMQKEDDGTWHIAGCLLAPSTVKAAQAGHAVVLRSPAT